MSSTSVEQKAPPIEQAKMDDAESAQDTTSFSYDVVPEEVAWWPSKLVFAWEAPLFKRATRVHKQGRALEHDNLLPLPSWDKGRLLDESFEAAWKELEDQYGPATVHKLEDLKGNVDQGTARLRRALMKVMGRRFIVAGIIKAINTSLQFAFPLLLNAILKFIQASQQGLITTDDPWHVRYKGYWLSVVLLITMASQAVSENAFFHRVFRAGYHVKVAVSMAVYHKSLRLTNAERQSTTLGELVNLMQVDASKIEMFIPQVHVLWDGVFQIVGYMTILYTLIGWPCFAGLVIMVLAGPVQGIVMKKLFGLTRSMVQHTDARVESTNEALQGIQCVKMYAWEESFARIIGKSRSQELTQLKEAAYLRGFSRAYMGALPGIVAVVSFVFYAVFYKGASTTPATLFSALVAFDQLRFPLLFYPLALAQLVQAKVSAARVEVFLGLKEVGAGDAIGNGVYNRESPEGSEEGGGEIVLSQAEVFWADPKVPIEKPLDISEHSGTSTEGSSVSERFTMREKTGSEKSLSDESSMDGMVYPRPALKNLDMTVANGELCAVVGRVASGKSTLCATVLNEAILNSGNVTVKGRVAYAAQSPWILNATVRENILFGKPMDEQRYSEVLQVCQLEHDLEMLEDGDLTDIGERGINLSGGQKARVSVARAAYADADTIILDDPLSALDPEVAKKLFMQCIVEFMKGKTRLLVTNQIQFLSSCDTVVALRKGEIVEQGKYTDLISDEKSEVIRLLSKSLTRKSKSEAKEEEPDAKKTNAPIALRQNKSLLTKEERNIGAVSFSVYKKYIKSGGGAWKFGLVYLGFILSVGNSLATNSWISYWTSDIGYEKHTVAFYLGIYFALAVLLGIVTFFRAFLLASFGVDCSENLHKNLLNSVLRAPMSFFDTTPLGRIISRFSKDIYTIDLELSDYIDFFLFCTLQVVTSLGAIIYVTPWFGLAVIPLVIIYFRFLNLFREVSRETKRLDSIARSPVYAHFSETLGGLTTIRAYGQATRFLVDFEERIDHNTRAYYNNKVADRWLSVRLQLIGASIAGIAAIFASSVAVVATNKDTPISSDFSSMAGLSLTYAISTTGLLQWCVRSFAQLESGMNASERILYYTEEIPQEAPYTIDEFEKHVNEVGKPDASDPSAFAVVASGGKVESPTDDWPKNGTIQINNLKMRYRSETPLVLKGLNVTISGGERIGVVGRTGSGKSSLMLTLLRLVEPSLDADSSYEAPVSVDGVDVLRIGLRDLRSKLGIIPQNPVLFSGTIRSNMDPFDQYTDAQIWDALSRCGLKEQVESMSGGLEATVAEYGGNLSSGMCQMLVLGRALLKQCRILLLDEATSSVDFETDREIQRTLRTAFAGCTVLTIAHRINTIMDSDKILVMKDGVAAEFASPQELLEDKSSIFSEIVSHAEADEE